MYAIYHVCYINFFSRIIGGTRISPTMKSTDYFYNWSDAQFMANRTTAEIFKKHAQLKHRESEAGYSFKFSAFQLCMLLNIYIRKMISICLHSSRKQPPPKMCNYSSAFIYPYVNQYILCRQENILVLWLLILDNVL